MIKELFTVKEAQELRHYLRKVHSWNVEVTPFPLPIDSGYVGFRRYPVGGSSGICKLGDENGYSLGFKVQGYYDVAGLRPALSLRRVVASIIGWLSKVVRSIVSPLKRSTVKEDAAV